jgi:predicted NAD/FAD-binding protein
MRIAVIGSGISGLVTANLLQRKHEVTVFEADDRIGGHTHTVDVELEGERHSVDTGFIVYNERTYPNFVRLLEKLAVETRASDMSFGMTSERTGIEWSSRGLRSVFAQPANLVRPAFHRMIRDILRFNREAKRLLDTDDEKTALGDFLCGRGYSDEFVEHYVVPMGAAIWSADPSSFMRIPATTFIRFFENHGLLELPPALPWRTIAGGSNRYLDPLTAPFRDRIRLGTRVETVLRMLDGVEVRTASDRQSFDHVVFAVHSDQALRLLCDPSELEVRLLSAIQYQENEVVLHTDTSLMPRSRHAWASWNYRVPAKVGNGALVTYDMNRLQGITSRNRFLVTLNGSERIAPERVLRSFLYHHPVFDRNAITAQKLHGEISGRSRSHFCGAYWGYGFHEDGVRSALEVCRSFGEEL